MLDAETLEVTEIVLDELVPRGDGLVLSGKTLYVVQNLPSAAVPGVPGQVAVVELSPDLSSGEVVGHLDDSHDPLINPATADKFGKYALRRAPQRPAACDARLLAYSDGEVASRKRRAGRRAASTDPKAVCARNLGRQPDKGVVFDASCCVSSSRRCCGSCGARGRSDCGQGRAP